MWNATRGPFNYLPRLEMAGFLPIPPGLARRISAVAEQWKAVRLRVWKASTPYPGFGATTSRSSRATTNSTLSLGQFAGETAVACIGHVEAIRADHRRRRQLLSMIPFLHDLESTKQADVVAMGDLSDHPFHLAPSRSRKDAWRVLQIHQNDVDPILLHRGDAAPDQLLVGG